jgi:uncharacterized phiE125 gp8 family phage protein
MSLTQTTAPASEPVTLAEVKEWLRMVSGDTSQDTTLNTLISACRIKAENYTGRSFVARTYTWELDSKEATGTIWLPRPDVTSITSLKTYDSDGNPTTVTSTNYELVEGLYLVPRNDGWTISRKDRAAQIVYVAGSYTDETDTPADIKTAIMRTIATQYELRTDSITGSIASDLTHDAMEILDDYKYYRPIS